MSAGLLAFQQHCTLLGWKTLIGDKDRYLYFPDIITSEVARAFTSEISRTDLPKVMSSRFEFTCDDLEIMLPAFSIFIPHTDWPQDFPSWLESRTQKYPNVEHLQINNLLSLLNPQQLGRLREVFPNLKRFYVQGCYPGEHKSTADDLAAVFSGIKIIL